MNKRSFFTIIVFELIMIFSAVAIFIGFISTNSTPLYTGLKMAHKVNNTYTLDSSKPNISERISLPYPEVSAIEIEGYCPSVSSNTILDISIFDCSRNQNTLISSESIPLSEVFSDKKRSYSLSLNKEDKSKSSDLLVIIQLLNPESSNLILTANNKLTLVSSFNDIEDDKTNIISSIEFGHVSDLSGLFVILALFIMIFVAVTITLINSSTTVISTIERLFLPCILLLGLCYQLAIPAYGAPDENAHIDTAYKYSNIILGIDDSDNLGTIYKRSCDVFLSDKLGLNLESGSYYQLYSDFLKTPADTSLMEVSFMDASIQVPGIVYLPAALGLTLGRLLSLSASMTYFLARYFGLLFYSIVIFLAIKITPYGKNVIAFTSMLPIAIQQGGSASYDSSLICMAFFFIALILRLAYTIPIKATVNKERPQLITLSYIFLAVVVGILITITKSGVYSPLILMGYYVFYCNKMQTPSKKNRLPILSIIITLLVFLIIICVISALYGNIFQSLTHANRADVNIDITHYTFSYIFSNPLIVLKLIIKTLFKNCDTYILSLLGARLGWLTIKFGWELALPFLIILIISANYSNDRLETTPVGKLLLLIPCLFSLMLIMMAMLLAYTPYGSGTIKGVQGRYFLPFTPLIFLCLNIKLNIFDKIYKHVILAFYLFHAITLFRLFLKVCSVIA